MKKTYIYILTLLISISAFSATDNGKIPKKKSEAPKSRTFAVEPEPAKLDIAENPKRNGEVVTATSLNLQSRTFAALDAKIEDSYFEHFNRFGEFTESYITENYPVNTAVNADLAKAIHTFNKINETGNYISTISSDNLIEFPVGLKKTVSNVTYTVGILSAKLHPEYTELTAFVRVVLPQLDELGNQKQIFFGATDIGLTHDGGIIGEWNLVLLGDFVFGISGGNGLVALKGGLDMESGNIQNKSYATIDCNGFKELHLEAEVQFSRNTLEPLKEDYTIDNSKPYPAPNQDRLKRVSGEFEITVQDWNNILVQVTLPRFQMTSFRGTAFDVNNAVFDFSDTNNSPDMTFPPNYEQYLVDGSPETWRGVYVESMEITLPKAFQRRNSQERVKFNVANLLVDGMGVSGEFGVDNVLPLNEGVADKWQFSVDHLEANIVANNLTGASFNGNIVLPISNEIAGEQIENNENLDELTLAYIGTINPIDNEYVLTVSNVSDINFDLWKARATITENSYVELALRDDKFKPKAVLHGRMYIRADNDENTTANTEEDTTVDFPQVTFQSLQLQTEMPVLSVDYMGYNGTVKLANFPVTISDIELTTTPTNATLSFDLGVHLMANQFNGETGLGIRGSFAENEGIQKWEYDKLVIDEIAVDANLGGVKFQGSVNIMDDDPVYGDGFRGTVAAQFKGLGDVMVSSTAIFGKTEFRYWYVDGLIDNLNIQTGTVFKIKGFGGGAYHKMKKNGFSSLYNASGANYIPDADTGLGVKAMLLYANAASARVFNGGLGFEIAFGASGGINRISFYGEGHVMQDFDFDDPTGVIKQKFAAIQEAEDTIDAATLEDLKATDLIEVSRQVYPYTIEGQKGINAYAAIEYDFTTSTLHGSYDLYIDVIGGLFKGRGANSRAGWAVLHFGPGEWYIHMGTPTDRLGIKFGVGSFSLETGGYLMIGDLIPGSPPPPPIVAQILGEDAAVLDYMRDENALSDGRGFAFGSDFSIDTGDITFLVFYARFQAGVGFDIMVKDYGEAACAGSGQVGINGWYTNGQAYAYLQGELGINLKLLFIKKKITILSAGAAVLLQAKLPNPSWFRGYLGGQFNILGGLVKGRFRLKIELGQECEFINSAPLDGLKVIADINPSSNSSNVDVFTVPQVGFNMKVNEPFEFEDDEGISSYRINLEDFKITNGGDEVLGTIGWNTNKDLLSFTPSEILPPETQLDLRVSVSFEQLQNGSWVVMTEDGQPAIETEERAFTTGVAPDYIPLSNVVYSYPVINQKYFYKDEYSNAYVKLRIGQSYLFNTEDGFSYSALFETEVTSEESSVSYNVAQKKVLASIPTLSNSEAYTFRIESRPPESQTSDVNESYVDQNVGEGNEIEVKNVSISGTATNAQVTEIISYDFNTSVYNTFQQKMNAKGLTNPLVDIIYSDVHSLEAEINDAEPFDIVELDGNVYTDNQPLIQVEARLDDTYYNNEIQPLVYQGYPLENQFTVDRDPNVLGLPPTKAVEKLTWYQTYLESNPTDPLLRTRLPFRYYLAFYYKEDFVDIQYKIVNTYLQDPASFPNEIATYDYMINGTFPYLKPGNYNSDISYVLPGGINGSSKIFTFNRPN